LLSALLDSVLFICYYFLIIPKYNINCPRGQARGNRGYLILPSKMTITPVIPSIAAAIVSGIHSGLVTHHQLQSIVPVNLSTRNTMNNIDPRPIPLDVLLSAIIIYYLICK